MQACCSGQCTAAVVPAQAQLSNITSRFHAASKHRHYLTRPVVAVSAIMPRSGGVNDLLVSARLHSQHKL